jgi:CBS-domain-containing membrane protein
MLKIRDIMTRDVFTLSPQATPEEAAWALAVRGISGAPVRDAMGRLLGVLSRADLSDPDRAAWRSAGKTVRDLMTPALLTLRAADPVLNAVQLMVREEIRRIVILDEYGQLAGIVTATDVLRALADGLLDDDGDAHDSPLDDDVARERATVH